MSRGDTAVADEQVRGLLSDKELEDAAVLTLREAAQLVRMPLSTANKLARNGQFPGLLPRLGRGKWMVSKKVFMEYLRSAAVPSPST